MYSIIMRLRLRQAKAFAYLCLSTQANISGNIRAENGNIEGGLSNLERPFHKAPSEYLLPVICELHPRTRSPTQGNYLFEFLKSDVCGAVEPPGLFDFVNLESRLYVS